MEYAIITAIFVVAILVILKMNENKERMHLEYAMREKTLGNMLPNRLQAYERLSLYLERINPQNMVSRELQKAQSSKELYVLLNNAVRQEFDHNIAMQIYIMPGTWDMIVNAKNSVIECINEEAKNIMPQQPAQVLATGIVGGKKNECEEIIKEALDQMRRDISYQFTRRTK
ncbi:MAG: hypothetical protein MJZ13_07415 [Bacteroidales bacterium]|nr:hypothetical protein [Bacteroidales bacterium]